MSEWSDTTLGELLLLQRGIDLPERLRRPGRYAVLGSNGPVGTHDEAPVRGPGVVIGRATNLGRPTYWGEDFWPLNTCLYVKDFRGSDPRYVYYLFESLDLSGFDSGSVQPMLNRNYIAGVPLRVPDLAEQQAIAGVLGALDDKIESNRRVWKLRQDIAIALFESFREKTEAEFSLGEIYQVGLSGVWGDDQPSKSACISTTCLRGRDLEDYLEGAPSVAPERYITPRQKDNRTPEVGEIWTAGSGSLGPSLLITEGVAHRWKSPITNSNFVKRLVPKSGDTPFASAFHVVWKAWRDGTFSNFRTGTAMPNLDPEALLRGLSVPQLEVSDEERLQLFTELAFDSQVLKESEALVALRDALLPELLSGRIRVRDAEKVVDGAV